jgi:nucleoside-diphosphate-sugar epimerase
MKLFITGASGFFGPHVAAAALRRGHQVKALVRSGRRLAPELAAHQGLEIVEADLRSQSAVARALGGADAVIHLAARLSGDFYDQFEGTVVATESLLAAMAAAGVRRLVHVSTFSVYGCLERWPFAVFDEQSPLEKHLDERDEYAITKSIQEQVVREAARSQGWSLVVLRPGVIYGRGNYFPSQIGMRINDRLWLRIGAWAPVPLIYVENCAEAVVLAAERQEAAGETINLVDDRPPTQRAYMNAIAARQPRRPRILPLPWLLLRGCARICWLANHWLLKGRAKLPGLLVPARAHARFRPFRYRNHRAKRILGWKPRFSLEQALDRTFAPDGESTFLDVPADPAASSRVACNV